MIACVEGYLKHRWIDGECERCGAKKGEVQEAQQNVAGQESLESLEQEAAESTGRAPAAEKEASKWQARKLKKKEQAELDKTLAKTVTRSAVRTVEGAKAMAITGLMFPGTTWPGLLLDEEDDLITLCSSFLESYGFSLDNPYALACALLVRWGQITLRQYQAVEQQASRSAEKTVESAK